MVSAARQEELRRSNTSVVVISRARMRTRPPRPSETCFGVPGVLTRRGSETAARPASRFRASTRVRCSVLLDGQPIRWRRGIKRGLVNLDRQSTARLDRVEVVKGASSALYGSDAIGGVINFITGCGAPLDVDAFAVRGHLRRPQRRGSRCAAGRLVRAVGRRASSHDGFDLTPTTFDTTGAPFARPICWQGTGQNSALTLRAWSPATRTTPPAGRMVSWVRRRTTSTTTRSVSN